MSDNISSESWPTWKIALAVGIPTAIVGVGGYYIYRSSKRKQKRSPIEKVDSGRVEPEGSSSPKPQDVESPLKPVKAKSAPALSKLEEAQNYKSEGNLLFKEGKYQDAIDKYTKAILTIPEDKVLEKATYHQNKAAALEKQLNWTGVIDECSAAIDLNHKYLKALQRRAKAYEKLGQRENCLEDITTVCILEGFQNPSNMMFADNMLKELGKEKAAFKYKNRKPVMPSSLFLKQYFATFQDDPTGDPLTEEMKAMSSTSGYIRAKMLMEEGKYADIIKECTQEIDASAGQNEDENGKGDNPSYRVEALLLRGTFHVLTCNAESGLEDLNEIINTKDVNIKLQANALIKRGSMNMQHQNTEKAEADITLACNIDPENCDVHFHRGQLNILMDNAQKALEDFDMCVQLKPDFAMAYAHKCYTKYRQAVNSRNDNELKQAMEGFESIIKKFPKCSETYALFAQALTDQENFQKADQLFQDAISVEPGNATLYVHRGLLALQWKQDLDQAVKLITKALEIDDKCELAHETLGTIEVQRGNLDKAKKHFDVSIAYAKTEAELEHLCSLQAAAIAQLNIAKKYGLRPVMPPGVM